MKTFLLSISWNRAFAGIRVLPIIGIPNRQSAMENRRLKIRQSKISDQQSKITV
jgi:hypothetical protein